MKDINPFTIVGSLYQGISALEAGNYTKKVMDVNARNALIDGMAEASRVRTAARLAIGRQAAGLAASGFAGDSGSALDALRESAIEAELEIMTAERRARAEAEGFRAEGSKAKAEGFNQFVGSIFSGAASIFDTKADYAKARS